MKGLDKIIGNELLGVSIVSHRFISAVYLALMTRKLVPFANVKKSLKTIDFIIGPKVNIVCEVIKITGILYKVVGYKIQDMTNNQTYDEEKGILYSDLKITTEHGSISILIKTYQAPGVSKPLLDKADLELVVAIYR